MSRLSVTRPGSEGRLGVSVTAEAGGEPVTPFGVKVTASLSAVTYPCELPCLTRTVADWTILPAGMVVGLYPTVIVEVSILVVVLFQVATTSSGSSNFALVALVKFPLSVGLALI